MLADLTPDGYVVSETILRGIVACMKTEPNKVTGANAGARRLFRCSTSRAARIAQFWR
jgi:hypothetical protein